MNELPGITHDFGPWLPVRFIPQPFQDPTDRPAFLVATTRMCRGVHDWRCAEQETQVYGPLILDQAGAELFRCDNCGRVQPPSQEGTAQCLGCSDMVSVQHLGDHRDDAAATAAAAILRGAAGMVQQASGHTDYAALLDDTADQIATLLENASWAIKQDPRRAKMTGYRALVLLARQVTANATTTYAPVGTEPLPVKEDDMRTEPLADQVTTTLGDHADEFDVNGIVTELRETHGVTDDIDTVDMEEYWKVVRKHEK